MLTGIIIVAFSITTSCLGISPGSVVQQGEAPFMVPVFNKKGVLSCTGVIINKEWILTSRGCSDAPWGTIIAGTTSTSLAKATKVGFAMTFAHASENGWPDVELGKLNYPLTFNETVQSITLSSQIPSGLVDIYAYGDDGVLLNAENQVFLSSKDCLKVIQDYPLQRLKFDPAAQICTVNASTVYGDVGGAVVQNQILVGLVQFHNVNSPGSPVSIHTITAHLTDWINETISNPVH